MGITLPETISIATGLESVSITVDENGVSTEISIGDSLFTPPSQNFILRLLKQGITPARIKNSRNNPF